MVRHASHGRHLPLDQPLRRGRRGLKCLSHCGIEPSDVEALTGLDADLPQILGYESKWEPDSPYWSKIKYHEAKLPEQKRRTLVDRAQLLFERLDCRDYARFDFRADANGEIKLLEANPNPGWCWDGKMNIMAGYAGLSYADMLRLILEAAQARYALATQSAPPASATVAS